MIRNAKFCLCVSNAMMRQDVCADGCESGSILHSPEFNEERRGGRSRRGWWGDSDRHVSGVRPCGTILGSFWCFLLFTLLKNLLNRHLSQIACQWRLCGQGTKLQVNTICLNSRFRQTFLKCESTFSDYCTTLSNMVKLDYMSALSTVSGRSRNDLSQTRVICDLSWDKQP